MLPLETALSAAWPAEAWLDVTVLVAVSGGADSMALLVALSRLKTSGPGRLVAAHFNHCLRGEASDGDATFVVQTCASLGVPVELGRGETLRAVHGIKNEGESQYAPPGGLEAAARAARYAFLTATAARLGARYVVMAHTADDQVETILQRILRGTGLAGLAGIPFTRRLSEATTVVRPLLGVTRAEVLEYLSDVGQTYRDDASNADQGFMRNRIRHELLPLLRDRYHPAVNESLLRLGQLADEASAVLAPQVQQLFDKGVIFTSTGFEIASAPFVYQPAYLIREVLLMAWRKRAWPEQDMGFAEWTSLAELLMAGPLGERRTLPGRIDVRRASSALVFSIY